MTCRERVWAALRGEPVDRPPVSFWGHFYDLESTAEDLVEATLRFQREYDWDWVKLNPRKHYHAEPWGVSYRYSGNATEKPTLLSWPIHRLEEYRTWARPYDARILGVASAARFNVLHVCKRKNLLFELADYPVSAFSWAATDPSNPSLTDALARLKGAVMGGISQEDALQHP